MNELSTEELDFATGGSARSFALAVGGGAVGGSVAKTTSNGVFEVEDFSFDMEQVLNF